MPRFRFRLDPLIRLRELEEGERRRALADVQRTVLHLETEIRTIQEQIATSRDALTSGLVGRIDVHAIRSHATMSLSLDNRARHLALQLADAYAQRQEARDALLDAVKERKSLERLREVRFESWKRAIEKREARELDDLVNGRKAIELAALGLRPDGSASARASFRMS